MLYSSLIFFFCLDSSIVAYPPHCPTTPHKAAMAKHHADLIFCRKQPGIAIGRLCEKCVVCCRIRIVGGPGDVVGSFDDWMCSDGLCPNQHLPTPSPFLPGTTASASSAMYVPLVDAASVILGREGEGRVVLRLLT